MYFFVDFDDIDPDSPGNVNCPHANTNLALLGRIYLSMVYFFLAPGPPGIPGPPPPPGRGIPGPPAPPGGRPPGRK